MENSLIWWFFFLQWWCVMMIFFLKKTCENYQVWILRHLLKLLFLAGWVTFLPWKCNNSFLFPLCFAWNLQKMVTQFTWRKCALIAILQNDFASAKRQCCTVRYLRIMSFWHPAVESLNLSPHWNQTNLDFV